MTAELAKTELESLKNSLAQCDSTIEEYTSRKLIIGAKIEALEKVIADATPAPAVPSAPAV